MDRASFLSRQTDSGNHAFVVKQWREQRLTLRDELGQLLAAIVLPLSGQQLQEQVTEFCANLLDYVCAGHFVIYHNLLASKPANQPETRLLCRKIQQYIGSSTDQILLFNAYCEDTGRSGRFNSSLEQVLGRLTRILLMRFALEEQLMELGNIDSVRPLTPCA